MASLQSALNLKPYQLHFSHTSYNSSTAIVPFSKSGSRKKWTTKSFKVRAEMKVFKGTHMRELKLEEMIEQKVTEAKQTCGEDAASDECKVAWDEVEEVSQAKADLRLKLHQLQQDPLQSFCQENPETDECLIYEE